MANILKKLRLNHVCVAWEASGKVTSDENAINHFSGYSYINNYWKHLNNKEKQFRWHKKQKLKFSIEVFYNKSIPWISLRSSTGWYIVLQYSFSNCFPHENVYLKLMSHDIIPTLAIWYELFYFLKQFFVIQR